MVGGHDIQAIVVETDMLLKNREGLLVHIEPKLLGCNLLGISLVRLEQVVIQVLRDLNSGSDIVAVRRKDDRLQFGKLAAVFPAFEVLCQFIEFLDIVTIHILQKIRHSAILRPEEHLTPGGRFTYLQHMIQRLLCCGEVQIYLLFRQAIGVHERASGQ